MIAIKQQQQHSKQQQLSSQGACWVVGGLLPSSSELELILAMQILFLILTIVQPQQLTQSLTLTQQLTPIIIYSNYLPVPLYYFLNIVYGLITYAIFYCCFLLPVLRQFVLIVKDNDFLFISSPSKSKATKATTKPKATKMKTTKATTKATKPIVVETVLESVDGYGAAAGTRLNDDAIDMFGSSTTTTTTTTTTKPTKNTTPVVAAPQTQTPSPSVASPPSHYVYDEEWSILLDGLIAKIHLVEGDLDIVERAIITTAGRTTTTSTTTTTLRLWGVIWNFQDQNHINNLITSLLCKMDEIDIPQRAEFLRSQRKEFVKRIEGLIDLWKMHHHRHRSPSLSSSSSSSKKSTTTTTTTQTKKEKRMAAKARARQWSDKTFKK